MVRLVAIMAIVAAVFAALTAFVLADAAVLVAVAVAIAAGIVLLMQRNVQGWVGGAVVLLLALLGALGVMGAVSVRGGGGVGFGIPEALGTAFLVSALVLVPAAAAWWRWGLLPVWSVAVGAGAAALAVILAFVNMDALGPGLDGLTIFITVLCLVAALPGLMMLMPAPLDEGAESNPRPEAARRKA